MHYESLLTDWTNSIMYRDRTAIKHIPKHELIHGQWYEGTCRNADKAVWNSASQTFFYRRTKFGSTFWEEIEHPENDRGYDLFFPITTIKEPRGESNVELRQAPPERTA